MNHDVGHRPSAAVAPLLVGLLVASLIGAPRALALFSGAAKGGPLTVASPTMEPAGEVSATQLKCRTNHTPEIEVSWSGTSSSYATSYTVERATSSAGSYTALATLALTATSYTDTSASLGYSTTYYYRVSVLYHSWSATSAVASVRTLSKSCQ